MGAAGRGRGADLQVRRDRWNGLYALHGWLDRGGACRGHREVFLYRRLARLSRVSRIAVGEWRVASSKSILQDSQHSPPAPYSLLPTLYSLLSTLYSLLSTLYSLLS